MLLLGCLLVICASECFDGFLLRRFLSLGEGNAVPSVGDADEDCNDELSVFEALVFAPSALVGFLPEIDEDCLRNDEWR